MPNPKDTKTTYLNCPLCNYGEFVNKNTYTFVCKCQTNPIVSHFPGCHKVHIECANKAIDEARRLIFHHEDIMGVVYVCDGKSDAPLEIRASIWLKTYEDKK